MNNSPTKEPETQQPYVWAGVDSLPIVRAQLAEGVPLKRIAKKFGISRQWLRQVLDKAEGPTPTGEPEADAKSEGTERGKDTPPEAEGRGTQVEAE
jgi:hypothetical protein